MLPVKSTKNQPSRFTRTENPTVHIYPPQHTLSLSSHLCTHVPFVSGPPFINGKDSSFNFFFPLSLLCISNPKIPHLCLNQKVIGHKRKTLYFITCSFFFAASVIHIHNIFFTKFILFCYFHGDLEQSVTFFVVIDDVEAWFHLGSTFWS